MIKVPVQLDTTILDRQLERANRRLLEVLAHMYIVEGCPNGDDTSGFEQWRLARVARLTKSQSDDPATVRTSTVNLPV